MSEHYDCTTPEGRANGISAAAAAVRRGDVVVLPTDTVYGIGCDAFDATAVTSVLAAKGRGRDMPPPVLIPTARTAQGLATQVPDYAQRLMERFWPGPLTLVLKAQTSLHWDLGETNGTVALRVPDHEIALELLGDIGPMAVTSANTTGDPAARTVEEARAMLGESVSVYLDGGPAAEGDPSTIIDCTGDAPETLRLGAISQEDIDAALAPDVEDAAEAADEQGADQGADKGTDGEPEEPGEVADRRADESAEEPGGGVAAADQTSEDATKDDTEVVEDENGPVSGEGEGVPADAEAPADSAAVGDAPADGEGVPADAQPAAEVPEAPADSAAVDSAAAGDAAADGVRPSP